MWVDRNRRRGLRRAAVTVTDFIHEAVATREVGIRRVLEAAVRIQHQGAVGDVRHRRGVDRQAVAVEVTVVSQDPRRGLIQGRVFVRRVGIVDGRRGRVII